MEKVFSGAIGVIIAAVIIFLSVGIYGEIYGDKYDGLYVVDGSGNIYRLNHRYADTYFVQLQLDNKGKEGFVAESNDKLFNAVKNNPRMEN